MKVTYYGHSCMGVNVNGVDLLFDPFITPNELAKHIDINSVPADYILVSHGHEDHLADVQTIAERTGAKIVSNFEIVSWFAEKGLQNGHPMNHGGN
ncbi:MAG TPA: hydrolase, partial [Flavobacteriales bacterium]|nr:hydrolase [Flavobacteriales bacterium]